LKTNHLAALLHTVGIGNEKSKDCAHNRQINVSPPILGRNVFSIIQRILFGFQKEMNQIRPRGQSYDRYNASVVKFNNTASSLVLFEIKNIFFYFENRST
jgi:hypothetical protein